MRVTLLLCLPIVLAGCGGTIGADEASCIQKFAVPAKSPLGVRAGYGFCQQAHSGKSDRPAGFYSCALPLTVQAENDLGVRVAVAQCDKQHPAPPKENTEIKDPFRPG